MPHEDSRLHISWSQNLRHPKTSNRRLKKKCLILFRTPWTANSYRVNGIQLTSLLFLICEHLFPWSSQSALFCILCVDQANSFCTPLFHRHRPFVWLFLSNFGLKYQGCLICMGQSPVQYHRCWAYRVLHKQLQ